ncbi:FMN-binding negative transcriptional regulator [Hyphococcus lacteus]|uniref:FMN-binding negative transcriptional regulator n=1 Tax=Hyphococcus lacteus TaxID=3143536 RepID=A0ABV3Z6V8_9PROT
MPSIFENFNKQDVSDLIAEYPLARVQPLPDRNQTSSLLPLLAEFDAEGAVESLVGHMARTNPLVGELSTRPNVTTFFQGPQSYISPSWVRKPDWAPTWNYVHLTVGGQIKFDALTIDDALERLVKVQESGRQNPWNITKMGERYRGLAAMVIPFRISVDKIHGKFKLGQDESPEIFSDIIEHLPSDDMARWMRRFNNR